MKNDEVIMLGEMVDLAGHKNRMYRTKIEDMTTNGLFLAGVPRFGGAPMPLHVNEDIFLVYYRPTGRFIVRMNVVGLEKRGDIRYVWLYQKTEPYKDQRREVFRVPVSRMIRVCEHPGEDETTPESGGAAEAGGAAETGRAAEAAETGESGETRRSGETGRAALAVGPSKTATPTKTGNGDMPEAVNSRDLSVTGVSFLTKKEYSVGDKRLLMIYVLENKDEDPPLTVSATVVRCMALRESGKNLVGMKFFGLGSNERDFISKFVLEEQRKQLKQKRLVEGV